MEFARLWLLSWYEDAVQAEGSLRNVLFSKTSAMAAAQTTASPKYICPDNVRLKYKIPVATLHAKLASAENGSQTKPYWSHTWYRNEEGEGVKISYAADFQTCEELAKTFVNEKILGFDMEWRFVPGKTFTRLQDNISLIQLARDGEVALFHIALHKGNKTSELIPPTLRWIITTTSITKAGVAIHNADGNQLRKFAGIKAEGLFELSHLHRLVLYAEKDPSKVTRSLVSLSNQIETHLGFPVFKGEVRTSNWASPLSEEQRSYAASDAYAGLVLYHVMNEKRKLLNPVPPLPEFSELFRPIRLGTTESITESTTDPVTSFPHQEASANPQKPRASADIKSAVLPNPRRTRQESRQRQVPSKLPRLVGSESFGMSSLTVLGNSDSDGADTEFEFEEDAREVQPKSLRESENMESEGQLSRKRKPDEDLAVSETLNIQLLEALRSLHRRLSRNVDKVLPRSIDDNTLQAISIRNPTATYELCRIPGGAPFLLYCRSVDVDLVSWIVTFGGIPAKPKPHRKARRPMRRF